MLAVLLLLAMVILHDLDSRTGEKQVELASIEMPPVYEDFQHAVVIHEIAQHLEPEKPGSHASPYANARPDAAPAYSSPERGIAIIIDDVGYDLHALERLLELPVPVAISILPDSPKAVEAARMAHRHDNTVMLHMPMEPANPKYRAKMDGSFLRGNMDKATIQSKLEHALDKVPYVKGLNNHMGSYLTTLEEPMNWVMEVSQHHQLFFVDSKTAGKSIADQQAKAYGLVWGKRSVFLDHSEKYEEMEKSWLSALSCAEKGHGCIVIGHPHESTLRFLEHKSRELNSEQEKLFKPVSALLYYPK